MSELMTTFRWNSVHDEDEVRPDAVELLVVPLKAGGVQLVVNQQGAGFFATAEEAIANCAAGHVATVVIPVDTHQEADMVSTKGLRVSGTKSNWQQYELEAQEICL